MRSRADARLAPPVCGDRRRRSPSSGGCALGGQPPRSLDGVGRPYRRNPTAFYLLLTAVCVALALGPPYGLWQFVYWMPGFNFIRGSSRFMVLGLLAIAVLAGLGIRLADARGLRRRAAAWPAWWSAACWSRNSP